MEITYTRFQEKSWRQPFIDFGTLVKNRVFFGYISNIYVCI